MKVWEADVLDAQSKEEPGTIVEVNKKEIIVATGSNDLALHEIQLAGKKTYAGTGIFTWISSRSRNKIRRMIRCKIRENVHWMY